MDDSQTFSFWFKLADAETERNPCREIVIQSGRRFGKTHEMQRLIDELNRHENSTGAGPKAPPKEMLAPGAHKDESWYTVMESSQGGIHPLYAPHYTRKIRGDVSAIFKCSHPDSFFKGMALFCPACEKVVGGL